MAEQVSDVETRLEVTEIGRTPVCLDRLLMLVPVVQKRSSVGTTVATTSLPGFAIADDCGIEITVNMRVHRHREHRRGTRFRFRSRVWCHRPNGL